MQVSRAATIWLEYHRSHSRENTLKSYQAALASFLAEFSGRQIGEISTEEILSFLNRITEGKKPQTRRVRYAHLSAFFNFIRNNLDPEFRNPCDTPAMKRLFRNRAPSRWNTIDKDTIDEVIFKTVKPRNRLLLELMARGGMRVGEVLKLNAQRRQREKADPPGTKERPDTGDRFNSAEGGRPPEGLPEGEIVQTGRQDLSDWL